jgi:hypothetical protein
MTSGIKGHKNYVLSPSCVCMYFCLTKISLHAHFLQNLEVQKGSLVFCMKTTTMEDAQGSYNDEEEFKGLHVNMGNVETNSNGRRDGKDPITMSILQREVHIYRANNENIMKAQEEILQSLNMLQRQANKDSSTKQAASARQVTTSRSHRKMDEHGNDK